MIDKIIELNKLVREKSPLVHNITNYVVMNDCANATLAIGGSPIMANEIEEVAEITSISSALSLNIGTITSEVLAAMLKASKLANERNIPIIFDPVGVSASIFRKNASRLILGNTKVSIIKGNLAEIAFLAGENLSSKGVDSSAKIIEEDICSIAVKTAQKFNCTVGITGKTDIIADGKNIVKILNGNTAMQKITGTGCMITSILGAYAGVTEDYFTATVAGILMMSLAGEIAYPAYVEFGTGTYRTRIIDILSKIDENIIKNHAKIEALEIKNVQA